MSFFSLPILLQIFCLYHAYKNHKDNYWYFVIIFLPVIGGVFYLITEVFNKKDVEKVQNSVTNFIIPTKRINDLKQKLEFSDTHENQVNLADAYFEIQDYDNAIKHYEKSLTNLFKNDEYTHRQLVKSYFYKKELKSAVEKGENVIKNKDFQKSDAYYYLGLSYAKLGHQEKAEEIFNYIDKPFSNYKERLNYANYLISQDKKEKAKRILVDLTKEYSQVSKDAKRKITVSLKKLKHF